MNANTKNPQIEHFLCPKNSMMHRPDMYNLQVRKKHLKNVQVKIHLTIYAITK